MKCTHSRLRCTNNVFYCLVCGAEVPNPYKHKGGETKPVEAKKTASKRKPKKESESV